MHIIRRLVAKVRDCLNRNAHATPGAEPARRLVPAPRRRSHAELLDALSRCFAETGQSGRAGYERWRRNAAPEAPSAAVLIRTFGRWPRPDDRDAGRGA